MCFFFSTFKMSEPGVEALELSERTVRGRGGKAGPHGMYSVYCILRECFPNCHFSKMQKKYLIPYLANWLQILSFEKFLEKAAMEKFFKYEN